jgi:membrane glycosyltransferase
MLEDFNVMNFLIIFFGFFALMFIVAIIGAVFLARGKNRNKTSGSEEKVIVEKETIKEIVVVPCEYCGSLNLQTALFCSNCGAGRKT